MLGPVAAGTPLLAVETIDEGIPVYPEWATGEELLGVRVSGERMRPPLWDGDDLLMRRQAAVEHEAIAVAWIEGEVVGNSVVRTGQHLT